MTQDKELSVLVASTITDARIDGNSLCIVIRSLMGKTRRVIVTISDGELKTAILDDVKSNKME